jgi:glycosyltransferase involved in cell wall biosynthesis
MIQPISVIIPTYQHATTIIECLESVLAQKRQADEIIVIDDGSTDGTKELLTPYFDRIAYYYQENAGAQAARMNGFNKSRGALFVLCDADIIMRSDMLGKLESALIDHPETSWAYSSFRWGWKVFKSRTFDLGALKQKNYIHTSALIRREHFPGLDLSIKRFQDWDLWLTMVEQGRKGVFVNQELFRTVHTHGRVGISGWLPKIVFKLPFKLPSVKRYETARDVINQKHKLSA